MKNTILSVLAFFMATSSYALDSDVALRTFKQNIQQIKTKVQTKKLSIPQASLLLLALQARQNNVIIAQQNEILKRSLHEPK